MATKQLADTNEHTYKKQHPLKPLSGENKKSPEWSKNKTIPMWTPWSDIGVYNNVIENPDQKTPRETLRKYKHIGGVQRKKKATPDPENHTGKT